MRYPHSWLSRCSLTAVLAALCAVAGPSRATDTYDLGSRQLIVPAFTVGSVTYSNAVVTVGAIVTAPHGSATEAAADSYDPVTRQLTVPAVSVAGTPYYNAVVTVTGLLSVGGVAGADSYANGYLAAATVQVGGSTYGNVVLAVTPASVVSVNGGMPGNATDEYDGASGHLAIPAVQVGSRVYTNVVIAVSPADIVAVGPAVTLDQVYETILGPYCAGCHYGGGASLPGVLDLSTASAAESALVGKASIEEPSVLRVSPGNPNASYLVQKLEGAPGIQLNRMPLGAALTPAQIEAVKSWVVGLAPP